MSLHRIILAVLARRFIALGVFSAVLASAGMVAFQMPPRFTATAEIFVNLADTNVSSPIPIAAARGFVTTRIEAMRSIAAARNVVERERLGQSEDWIAAYRKSGSQEMPIEDWIAGAIFGSVKIIRQGASDIIDVAYSSADPAIAAKMANAFAEVFVQQEVELRAGPAQALVRFSQERLANVKARISDLEQDRSRLRAEAAWLGELAPAGRPDAANGPQSIVSNAQANLLRARSALDLALAGQASFSDNAEIIALRRQIGELDLALERDLPLLGRAHRRIQGLTANRDNLSEQLKQTIDRLRQDLVQERERELVVAERALAEAFSLVQREESQRSVNSASRARLDALDSEIEGLRSEADALVKRRERALVDSTSNSGYMTILSRATVPANPSWPNKPLILGVAAVFGLALGLVLAFVVELLDSRIRGKADIEESLDAPVLGTVSNFKPRSSLVRLRYRPIAIPGRGSRTIEHLMISPAAGPAA